MYLVLNFSNKILYVKILKSLSYDLNSSITSSLTLDSATGVVDKYSNRANLLDETCSTSITPEDSISISEYKAAWAL